MPGSTLESATTDDTPTLRERSVGALRQPGMLARLVRTPAGVIGLGLVLAVVLTAIFADTIAPGDPFDTYAGPALTAPSGDNILGTDNIGRDMFTGIVHGTRTSMIVVFWVVTISTFIGVFIGLLSGYRGGLVDDLLMRIAELFQVVPRFFLALLVASFFGPGLDKLILLLGLTSWPFLARVVRAETIRLKQREFIEGARVAGASASRVMAHHVLPNLLPPVIVVVALFASRVIMIEAGLAFLGVGDPNRISLGYLANNGGVFMRLAWWMAVFPGLAIVMAVLGLNLLGDALNDAVNLQG